MCGIVGITSSKEVTPRIISSLKKLEYRGYDSAGIATLSKGNINEVKCEGRVDVLEKNISGSRYFYGVKTRPCSLLRCFSEEKSGIQ